MGRGARGARCWLRARRMQSIVVVRPGNTGSGFRPWLSPQGKIANPFVRPDPNMGPGNDRATWSRVLLPFAMIMSTTPTPDSWPWMIVSGVVVSAATAWMLYENRNAAVKGINA